MTKTVWELLDLTGEVIIVTGGPGKLGSQMSDALAEAGANVVVVSRTYADCVAKAEELSEEYNEALPIEADVMDKEAVERMVGETVEYFGHLDGIVNNAYTGEGYGVPFEELSLSDWESMLDGVLTQTFLCSQAVVPHLREAENSIIVNIGSHYGVVAPDHRVYGDSEINNPPNYGAAKAGVIQLTKWLATYLAEDNIRVNALTPGGFYSEEMEDVEDYTDIFVPNYVNRTPLGRMGDDTDLKGAIVFLASEGSKWMTGQNVIIDGGWTTW